MRAQSEVILGDAQLEQEEDVHVLTPADMEASRPYTYRVWWSDEDDAYLASVEELPEVLSHGGTEAQALEMAHEAAATALWSRRDLGHEIAPPSVHGQDLTAWRVNVAPASPVSPDTVRALRAKLRMSQSVFAQTLEVSVKSVQAWERGTGTPAGAARRLMSLFEQYPGLVTTTFRERQDIGHDGEMPVG